MQSVNIRKLALESLLLIIYESQPSSLVTKEILDKYDYLEARDKAFYQRLVQGVLERRIYLDEIINQVATTKVNKMRPVIRTCLELGVYELKCMDAVPDFAAVSEYVKLIGKKGFMNLKGFANAILRGVADGRYSEDKISKWAKLCLPQWLYEKWCAELGEAVTEEMAKAFLSERKTWIKVNTSICSVDELIEQLEKEGVKAVKDELLPGAVCIANFGSLAKLEAFRQGKFYVMDHSSQQAMDLVLSGIEGSELKVLDLCASPGGKSICAAVSAKVTLVESRDVSELKVSRILDNASRLKLSDKLKAKVWDATDFDAEAVNKYDLVICDVPCSGLGDLGRKPDIKLNASNEGILSLVDLQRKIIDEAIKYVAPGGRLMYSTCTISREENEVNQAYILDKYKYFTKKEERLILPDGTRDGFYVAVFEKNE